MGPTLRSTNRPDHLGSGRPARLKGYRVTNRGDSAPRGAARSREGPQRVADGLRRPAGNHQRGAGSRAHVRIRCSVSKYLGREGLGVGLEEVRGGSAAWDHGIPGHRESYTARSWKIKGWSEGVSRSPTPFFTATFNGCR